jgi:hypothetical protein
MCVYTLVKCVYVCMYASKACLRVRVYRHLSVCVYTLASIGMDMSVYTCFCFCPPNVFLVTLDT